MRWAGHVAHLGEMRNVYKILARKPEGRNQLKRLRRRWKVNIRIEIREVGWEGVDWIHLTQERDQWQAVMNMVMNLWVL
jgi:hypothetical protein